MVDPTVDDLEEPMPASDERDLVAAGIAQDAIEADILRRACEDAGIEALVAAARGGMVDKLSNPSEGWAILVPAPDRNRAHKLITETRKALEADPEANAAAAEMGEEAEEAGETVPTGR